MRDESAGVRQANLAVRNSGPRLKIDCGANQKSAGMNIYVAYRLLNKINGYNLI